MTERTLFPDDDPSKSPPKTPHNGTVTSRHAAELAKPFAPQQQEQVFQAIAQAGANGMTDQEVEDTLGISGNSVRPRRTALVKADRVKDSGGLRPTKSGRAAVVWIVCSPEQEPVHESKADWPLDCNSDTAPRQMPSS